MDARLDGVLAMGRALGLGRVATEQVLLGKAQFLLNGDSVGINGEQPAVVNPKREAREAAAALSAREAREAAINTSSVDGVELDVLDDDASLGNPNGSTSGGNNSVTDGVGTNSGSAGIDLSSECATAGPTVHSGTIDSASVGTRDDELLSQVMFEEFLLDDTAARKRNYLGVAGANEERSTEALLVHLTGCFVISTTMERIGAPFCSDGFWSSPVAVVRTLPGTAPAGEWLITGFAVGTRQDNGQRSTCWRGRRLCNTGQQQQSQGDRNQTNPQPSMLGLLDAGLEWFDLPREGVDQTISVCVKKPASWSYKVRYGLIKESKKLSDVCDEKNEYDEMGMEVRDDEVSPHYVLTAPGNVECIQALITFELLNDINYIEGTRLDVFAVSAEDYDHCDDPRAFWTNDCRLASSEPAGRMSSMTGIQLELHAEQVYMVVPDCSLPLRYCVRIASEYSVDIYDIASDSEDSNYDDEAF